MYRKEEPKDPVLEELKKITALLSVIAKQSPPPKASDADRPTFETLTREDG